MQSTTKTASQKIPVSLIQPIRLERPLELFGKTFDVNVSTGLTFSPDTLLQITTGMSLLHWLRVYDKEVYDLLKALIRGATRKNKLSGTTQLLIQQKFDGFFPPIALDEAMDGKELTIDLPWQSDWETLQQAMGNDIDDDLIRPLVSRFAQHNHLIWSAKQFHANGAMNEGKALLAPLIDSTLKGWMRYNPNLQLPVAILVDISLQTLVWLELRSDTTRIESVILPLLESGKKPMGHWILKIQKIAKCKNLNEMSVLMARKGIKLREECVTHDLLKKWSSGKQLMSSKGVDCMLQAIAGKVDEKHERGWIATVRFLSFLCDLVIAGTRGEPPSWACVQNQVFMRYSEFYKIESNLKVAN